jgi:hypothetical protein
MIAVASRDNRNLTTTQRNANVCPGFMQNAVSVLDNFLSTDTKLGTYSFLVSLQDTEKTL